MKTVNVEITHTRHRVYFLVNYYMPLVNKHVSIGGDVVIDRESNIKKVITKATRKALSDPLVKNYNPLVTITKIVPGGDCNV